MGLNSFVLTLSIAIFSWLFTVSSATAAEWAYVSADKAVIYADKEMSSAIGYIKKGKKIRVGEVAKNKGRVVAIIISRKVAYIKVEDIKSSKEQVEFDKATERLRSSQSKDKTTGRVAGYLGTGATKLVFNDAPTSDNNTLLFYGGGMRVYQAKDSARFGVRGSIDYYVTGAESQALSVFNIPIDYYMKVFKSSIYDLNLYAGGSWAPFVEYKVGSDFTLNSWGLGAQAGAEMVFKYAKYALHLDGGYYYTYLQTFKLGDNIQGYPEEIELDLHAVRLTAALSYAF